MLSQRVKTGLGLAFLLGLLDIAFNFIPFDVGTGDAEPPLLVVVLGWITGVLTIASVIWYWLRPNRAAKLIIYITRVVSALTGIPAFIFGAPQAVQVIVAIQIVVTIVCLVLLARKERITTA